MPRDRARVLVLAIACLALVVVTTLVKGWFVIEIGGLGKAEMGLRSVSACNMGTCAEIKASPGGLFGVCANIAYFGSFAIALIVLYQTYLRVTVGYATPELSHKGIFASVAVLVFGFFAAFVFGPDSKGAVFGGAFGVSVDISRSWGIPAFFAAHFCGIAALHVAASETSGIAETHPPVTAIARPTTPEPAPAPAPVEVAARPVSMKMPAVASSTKIPVITPDPDSLEAVAAKKLSYVVSSGEVTRAGIDARRGDGKQLLVMWRDVVGFVVRRAPEELGGVTFADIVSVKGNTLRIVPTTRLTGISVMGFGEDRIRSLATYVQSVCPELAIDGATKKFLGGEPAGQLKDIAMLATHDERLS